MSQINQFRSLAQTPSAQKPALQRRIAEDFDDAPTARGSAGEKVRDGLSRFLGVFVSIYEVGRTGLKVLFLSLPILGPIGLIVYNLDFKGATQKSAQKSIAEQLGIAGMVAYAGNLFRNMDKAPMVFTTAAGLVKGGKGGDLPQAGEPDLKSLFDAELPKGSLAAPGAGLPEEPAAAEAAGQGPVTATNAVKKPPPKLSPATVEKNDANEVMRLLAKVEADYRTFSQADAAFAVFMQRYGKSKFRASLQQKRDDVARIPPRAIPERAMLSADSRISGVRLAEGEAREVQACLQDITGLKAAAIVRKSVTIQSSLPAYVVLVDAAGPEPAGEDAGERLALGYRVSLCLGKRNGAGSLAVAFWGDALVKKIATQAAEMPTSLVYVRG